jgi:hypothetical protein
MPIASSRLLARAMVLPVLAARCPPVSDIRRLRSVAEPFVGSTDPDRFNE